MLSSSSVVSPATVASLENLTTKLELCMAMQLWVYREGAPEHMNTALGGSET